MAKEATIQVRMDSEMKENVEDLYRRMGTSFAEAVRIFAAHSLMVNGLPFPLTVERPRSSISTSELAGSLRKYATPEKLSTEEAAMRSAFSKAAIGKHGSV